MTPLFFPDGLLPELSNCSVNGGPRGSQMRVIGDRRPRGVAGSQKWPSAAQQGKSDGEPTASQNGGRSPVDGGTPERFGPTY